MSRLRYEAEKHNVYLWRKTSQKKKRKGEQDEVLKATKRPVSLSLSWWKVDYIKWKKPIHGYLIKDKEGKVVYKEEFEKPVSFLEYDVITVDLGHIVWYNGDVLRNILRKKRNWIEEGF